MSMEADIKRHYVNSGKISYVMFHYALSFGFGAVLTSISMEDPSGARDALLILSGFTLILSLVFLLSKIRFSRIMSDYEFHKWQYASDQEDKNDQGSHS